MILAGVLASTVLRGLHFSVAALHFGPYDTVFAVAGLLFVIGGLSAIAPMRRAGRPAAGEAAPEEESTAEADVETTDASDADGPAVAASD